MTISEASKKLNLSEQLLRCWIQSGSCEFGYIIRPKASRTGRNTYYINEQALKDFIEGKNNEQTDLL